MLRGERGGEPSTLEDTGLHQGLIQNTHIQSNQWDSSAVFFLKLPSKKKKSSFLKIPGFPGGSVVKCLPANAGDAEAVPGLGRCPGGGNGDPLQYSCLEIPRTEEPGGLQPVGSQRVRHNLATQQQQQYMTQCGSVLGVLGLTRVTSETLGPQQHHRASGSP